MLNPNASQAQASQSRIEIKASMRTTHARLLALQYHSVIASLSGFLSRTTARKALQLSILVSDECNFGMRTPFQQLSTRPSSTWLDALGVWNSTTFPGLSTKHNLLIPPGSFLTIKWQCRRFVKRSPLQNKRVWSLNNIHKHVLHIKNYINIHKQS